MGGPAFFRRELHRYHKTCNLEHDISLQHLRIAKVQTATVITVFQTGLAAASAGRGAGRR